MSDAKDNRFYREKQELPSSNESAVLVALRHDTCEAAERCEPCKGLRQMAIAEIERLQDRVNDLLGQLAEKVVAHEPAASNQERPKWYTKAKERMALMKRHATGTDVHLLEMACADYDSLQRDLYLLRIERSNLQDQAHERATRPAAEPFGAQTKINNLIEAVNAKQAKIDALMLEFCPGEMSAEQREELSRADKLRAALEPAGVKVTVLGAADEPRTPSSNRGLSAQGLAIAREKFENPEHQAIFADGFERGREHKHRLSDERPAAHPEDKVQSGIVATGVFVPPFCTACGEHLPQPEIVVTESTDETSAVSTWTCKHCGYLNDHKVNLNRCGRCREFM